MVKGVRILNFKGFLNFKGGKGNYVKSGRTVFSLKFKKAEINYMNEPKYRGLYLCGSCFNSFQKNNISPFPNRVQHFDSMWGFVGRFLESHESQNIVG